MRSQMLVQLLTWVVCSVRLVALFLVSLIGCSNSGRLISFTVQILSANAKANGRHPELSGCLSLFFQEAPARHTSISSRHKFLQQKRRPARAPVLRSTLDSQQNGCGWLTFQIFHTVRGGKFCEKNRKILTRRDYFYFFVRILWTK